MKRGITIKNDFTYQCVKKMMCKGQEQANSQNKSCTRLSVSYLAKHTDYQSGRSLEDKADCGPGVLTLAFQCFSPQIYLIDQ